MHDAIALETQGIPTIACCTADFLPGGRMQASALGMPGYPILCVPQNYITHAPQQVRDLADACLDELLQRLLIAD